MKVETRRLRLRCRGARRRRVQQGVFSYKKGEWGNPLILLNRKRQILTVNRQIASANRQKQLALLSV
jgi:ureidoglycolate hydrolase